MKKSKKAVEKNEKKILGSLLMLNISLNMMILLTLCAAKKELEEDYKRVDEAYFNFSGAVNAVLDDDQKSRDGVIRTGKKYLNELNQFEKLPEAKDKEIQKLVGDVQQMTRDLIS